jgi:hypothetical protein
MEAAAPPPHSMDSLAGLTRALAGRIGLGLGIELCSRRSSSNIGRWFDPERSRGAKARYSETPGDRREAAGAL